MYVFVLDALPEPLDKHIVHPVAPAVHAGIDNVLFKDVPKVVLGKLAALVHIEYLRCAIERKRLFQGLRGERGVQCVRKTP